MQIYKGMSINNLSILNWSDSIGVHKVNGLYVLDNPVWIDFLYNDNNPLYNIAGICHDGAYGSELLSKDIADELFYQGLLKAGISKSKAYLAKWAVEHLAGLHYGRKNDDFGISEYVNVEAIS